MSDEKPKDLTSGLAMFKGIEHELTPGEKLDIVIGMVKKIEECPECGHLREVGFLSPEEARNLLGFEHPATGEWLKKNGPTGGKI